MSLDVFEELQFKDIENLSFQDMFHRTEESFKCLIDIVGEDYLITYRSKFDQLFQLLERKMLEEVAINSRLMVQKKVEEIILNTRTKYSLLLEECENVKENIRKQSFETIEAGTIDILRDKLSKLVDRIHLLLMSLANVFGSHTKIIGEIANASHGIQKKKELIELASKISSDVFEADEKFRLSTLLGVAVKLSFLANDLKTRKSLLTRLQNLSSGPQLRVNRTGVKSLSEEVGDIRRDLGLLSPEQLELRYSNSVKELVGILDADTKAIEDELTKLDSAEHYRLLEKKVDSDKNRWERGYFSEQRKKISELKEQTAILFNKYIEILPFDPFPPGKVNSKEIKNKLLRYGVSVDSIEIKRLEAIERELPDFNAIGIGNRLGFDGYVVYRYKNTNTVIAERAIKDNATYLFKEEWDKVKQMLRLSKEEARESPATKRVFHHDETQWLNELKFIFYNWH
jgi:hypothetical protein